MRLTFPSIENEVFNERSKRHDLFVTILMSITKLEARSFGVYVMIESVFCLYR